MSDDRASAAIFDDKGDFAVSELQTLRWFAIWLLLLATSFYVSRKNVSEDDCTMTKEIFIRAIQHDLLEKSLPIMPSLVK